MKYGRTPGMILGSALTIGVAGLVAMTRSEKTPLDRGILPPISVQRAFQSFADSTGKGLLDTLFALGYHGGYSWDEKKDTIRPNLIARTERQTVKDSATRVYEGTITLDLHHDSSTKVPSSMSIRFTSLGDATKWILLTTDGFPFDPRPELRLDAISKLPAALHAAVRAAFGDRAEAFEYWNNLEREQALASYSPPKGR